MLKNIISAVFLTTIIASSTVSIAATTHQAHENITLTNAVLDENAIAETTNSNFQAEEASNVPSAAAGWTFALALLGFVMLSNRRGV